LLEQNEKNKTKVMTELLSIDQERVLKMASDQKPVYVERYDFYDSAPTGRTFFGKGAMTTFSSLLKGGLLAEDDKAGYTITAAGLEILRTARIQIR
jgi:hypothetical protein